VGIALIITHRKNIERLVKGEEKKLINWGKKDKTAV
jgi:glycerol-3-phosphate acyltransferase PlsY